MKELFIAIQNQLVAEVPALQFIDFDLGQLEQQPQPSLDYPAALISFGDSPFMDLGQLAQQAQVQIVIRFAFRVFERTHNIAADQYRTIGLQHLDTVEAAKWALHGFSGTNFNDISHRGFSTEPRADLRVYQLTFETLLSAMPPIPNENPTYVHWTEAVGAIGLGPDLCIEDEENQSLLS